MSQIYCITNKVNGKKYVGQTVRHLSERLYRHLYYAKRYNNQFALYRAIRKYGDQSFDIESLETSDIELLNEREQYWIKELDTMIPKGYNMTLDGRLGEGMTGRTQNEETKKKIGKANSGRPQSDVTRRKRADALAQWWRITLPNGVILWEKNLQEFCKERGLHPQLMSMVASGKRKHHRRYKCEKL